MNRKAATTTALLVMPLLAFAQSAAAPSAEGFFSQLSASYGGVRDYEATLTITRDKKTQVAKLSYKSPLMLNVKFDDPPDEVINFNGEDLIIYDTQDGVVLKQSYPSRTPAQLEGLVTSQGLGLWQRTYSIGYLTGPAAVPLDDASHEMVVKLKLEAKAAASYSQMIVSVNKDLLIVRRIEGTLVGGEKVVMDFTNVKINPGLPDSRFEYKEPPNVYMQPDWLFDPEE